MTDYHGVSCPRCHRTDQFVIISEKSHKFLKCERCNHLFIDEQLETAYGVKRCPDGTYETDGELWQQFPCEYCMTFFDTFEEVKSHKKANHKVGDYMACMEV